MSANYEPATDGAVDPDVDMVDAPTTSVATAPEPAVADQVEPAPLDTAPAVPDPETAAPGVPVDVDPVAEALAAISADAKSRGVRTLVQGAVTAALSSAGLVVLTYVRKGDVSHLDYKVVAEALGMAAGTGVVSYLHNIIGNKRA